MAKQIKELRNFIEGTNSAPSASDVPDEAPIYSLNIEALDEEGKLKGSRKNVPVKQDGVLLTHRIDLGSNAAVDDVVHTKYNIFGTTYESQTSIFNTSPAWVQNKAIRKTFRSQIENSDYVSSVCVSRIALGSSLRGL